jgi:hypothetical protein
MLKITPEAARQAERTPDVEQGLHRQDRQDQEPVPGERLAIGEDDREQHAERQQQLLKLDDHVAERQAAAGERECPDQRQVVPHHHRRGDTDALGEVEHEDAGDQERDVVRHSPADVEKHAEDQEVHGGVQQRGQYLP